MLEGRAMQETPEQADSEVVALEVSISTGEGAVTQLTSYVILVVGAAEALHLAIMRRPVMLELPATQALRLPD